MAWSRERAVIVPLVGVVVLAVAVLATIMFRSSFQMEQLRERSVVEATLSLANDKADRLEKRIIEQDNAVAALTEGEDALRFGDRWLMAAPAQTPTVRALLLIDLDSPSREVVGFASRAPGGDDNGVRRILLHQLWPEMKLGGPNPEQLRHLHTSVGDKSYLISHFERTHGGERFLVVAWHDVPRIVHELFPRLYEAGTSQANRVNVVDAEGRIVFGPPLSRGALTLGKQFATTLYKWRVNVSIAAAEQLAKEVERRRLVEMGLVGLSSLVVIGGLIVIMVAAARERRLAMLKSEFVANVSHELKTPLALVRMFSEMLLSGRAPATKQQQYLEIIVKESERLTALIDNVLDFARMERRGEAYEFSEADIREPITRAVDVCRPRAERQSVPLELDLSLVDDGRAKLDERAIEIALINLIDNALKYAPESKRIRISVSREGDKFIISVTDGGAGIPKDQRKKIFDRFVRGKGTAAGTRGSGIGLALVAQIADAHGGRAWVEDSPSGGAQFTMSVTR
jgi:two-component system, OmpR family, phosphate regulon sensor histidine kinase PhoR